MRNVMVILPFFSLLIYSLAHGQELSEKDFEIRLEDKLQDDDSAKADFKALLANLKKAEEEVKKKEQEDEEEHWEDRQKNTVLELKKLLSFIKKYPGAKSSLTAKVRIASVCFDQRIEGIQHIRMCQKLCKEIMNKYPDSWQGKYTIYLLANSYPYDKPEDSDRMDIKKYDQMMRDLYKKSIDLLESNFDKLKGLDDEKDEEFIEMDQDEGGENRKFSGWVLSNIAAKFQHMGEKEKAIKMYERIIKDYPNTGHAKNAKEDIESIKNLEILQEESRKIRELKEKEKQKK